MNRQLKQEEQQHLKHLSNVIREYRKRSRLTQEQLAERIDVDRHTIANIESGDREYSIITFFRTMSYLKIPMDLVFSPISEEQKRRLGPLLVELADADQAQIDMVTRLAAVVKCSRIEPEK